MKELTSVSVPTVRRLPLYMAILKEIEPTSEHVSSTLISDRLGLEQIQVRKDLAGIGVTGQPAVGFNVRELIGAIEQLLGWDNIRDAILVGTGNLGQALLGYDGFARYGLNIVAAFDSNPEIIGMKIHGKPVFDIEVLSSLTERMHIQIGILAVPGKVAQQVADTLIEAGIHAIWNFTPVKLNVSDNTIVEQVDLAASLAVLSSKLKAVSK
ncbi:MAG TPA: redox-sensing transcriptional repressor Rex [Anaerohalosphaeraceae bacterium]|nr:redox-sensing transcriptional repressor Rex [Anaerohalosphaeraceae bacterium]